MDNALFGSSFVQYLFVFLGGGVGSWLRYLIYKHGSNFSSWEALGTFLANIISCLVLGYLYHKLSTESIHVNNYSLLAVGFCGGLSTFSTLILELYKYSTQGSILYGLAYVAASIIVGVICLIIGIKLGNSF